MQPRGLVIVSTTNKFVTLHIRAIPVPANVVQFLTKHSSTIKRILNERAVSTSARRVDDEEEGAEDRVAVVEAAVEPEKVISIDEFRDMLIKEFESTAKRDAGMASLWNGVVDQ